MRTERAFTNVAGRVHAVLLATLLLGLTADAAKAQTAEDSKWVFGTRAGLDFSAGQPVPFSTPPMPGAQKLQLVTLEGSAAVSNKAGDLLFYTDGKTVRNPKAKPIGTGLLGSSDATQSALIVPWPGTNCSKYFVFTVKGVVEGNQTHELRYSVVDLGDPSSSVGLGSVGPKNVVLPAAGLVAEKLAAIRVADGYWVVVHGFDHQQLSPQDGTFFAFKVDASGVVPTPVVSSIGSLHKPKHPGVKYPLQYPGLAAGEGQMKISPDGSLIAVAVRGQFVEVLDFAAATGQVTGLVKTWTSLDVPGLETNNFYGVEFSPDSQLLYASTTGLPKPNQLVQLAIPPNAAAPTVLAQAPPSTSAFDFGALQLGPDGRIYLARNSKPYLGVIAAPNAQGPSCQFDNDAQHLAAGTQSQVGLPAVIQRGTATSCCDQLDVAIHDNDLLTQKYLTLDVFNIKDPPADITSVHIDMLPLPTGGWQGGGLQLNTGNVLMPVQPATLFRPPYDRVPYSGDIAAVSAAGQPALRFNLGIDFSTPYTGTVTLTVNHKGLPDNKCLLTYGPFTVP